MTKILIICTANICRSPVGEAVLQDRLHAKGLTSWEVDSAGTWAQDGRAASRYSVEVLAERESVDIGAHQAKTVDKELLEASQLVLCMTKNHAEALRVEFPEHALKIYLLSQMVGNRRFDIGDPYGTEKPNYVRMYTQVKDLIEEGLPRIIDLALQS